MFLLCLSLFIQNSYGQSYRLSFKAAGESTKIDSVKVENFSSRTIMTISGAAILNLTAEDIDEIANIPGQISKSIEKPMPVSDNKLVKMHYEKGNLIRLTGYSGKNKTVVMTIPENDTIISFYFAQCVDIDGNSYAVMQIGKQLWMVDNLKTTHYRNGDTIPYITDKYQWDTLPHGAYRNYFDMTKYVSQYGCLYNWFAVNDSRGLAPVGWHIPDVDEWTQMENVRISGDKGNSMGSRLKEMALTPAGYCDVKSGFGSLGQEGFWWLSFEDDAQKAWYIYLNYRQSSVSLTSCDKNHGFSVRCVKDIK